MLDKKVIEDSIKYHEWNLARMITEQNKLIEKVKAGDIGSKMEYEQLGHSIKWVKEIIHNYKTIGRAYK